MRKGARARLSTPIRNWADSSPDSSRRSKRPRGAQSRDKTSRTQRRIRMARRSSVSASSYRPCSWRSVPRVYRLCATFGWSFPRRFSRFDRTASRRSDASSKRRVSISSWPRLARGSLAAGLVRVGHLEELHQEVRHGLRFRLCSQGAVALGLEPLRLHHQVRHERAEEQPLLRSSQVDRRGPAVGFVLPQHLGDAEIEQLRSRFRVHEHVRRLEVAMNHQMPWARSTALATCRKSRSRSPTPRRRASQSSSLPSGCACASSASTSRRSPSSPPQRSSRSGPRATGWTSTHASKISSIWRHRWGVIPASPAPSRTRRSRLTPQLPAQPGSGQAQLPVHGGLGDVEGFGHFGVGEPTEEL